MRKDKRGDPQTARRGGMTDKKSVVGHKFTISKPKSNIEKTKL
jgi:hypothetical protein